MNQVRTFALWGLALVVLGLGGCMPGSSPQPTLVPTAGATAPVPPFAGAAADNWDDRSIFRAGLVGEQQGTLDILPGASVYHLDVRVAADLLSLQGRERVRYTNQETGTLDVVYFQLFPNMAGGKTTVTGVSVNGRAVSASYELRERALRVPLTEPLPPGGRTVIQMDFQVAIPSELGGGYGLFGYLNGILALDGFYPAIPVYDAGEWQSGPVPPNADTTFQDAGFYLVRVTAPSALTLVASGVTVASASQGGEQMVTFAAGPARDFYLAASDRFAVTSERIGETRVNSYSFTEREEGRTAALRTAIAALRSYSARFGIYPYTEFDVVSTPMQGATGIEYPGITGINLAVYDPKATVSGVAAPLMLESTVAHEVGHQWFYNLVGNDQADEPWLDEAITQYVTGLYYLDTDGAKGMDGYRSTWVSRWDRVNRQIIPIGLPAGVYQGREYGAIVYGRGPLFVEALAKQMGQTTFDWFLRDYVQANQWGIATTASFKALAEKECGCDLTAMFAEWVYSQ